MPRFTASYDVETGTLSFGGIDAHSHWHLMDALMVYAGLTQSDCVMDLHNDLAAAYNEVVNTIPADKFASVDQQAESYVARLGAAMEIGLTPRDNPPE